MITAEEKRAHEDAKALVTMAERITALANRNMELAPFVQECAESWPCDHDPDGEHSGCCRKCTARKLLGLDK